jgi:hypothetical protein
MVGFEVSSFQPAGSDERWWVSRGKLDEAAMAQLNSRARGAPLTVEFRGVTSDRGRYGHMGLYQREFVVDSQRELSEQPKEEKTE